MWAFTVAFMQQRYEDLISSLMGQLTRGDRRRLDLLTDCRPTVIAIIFLFVLFTVFVGVYGLSVDHHAIILLDGLRFSRPTVADALK